MPKERYDAPFWESAFNSVKDMKFPWFNSESLLTSYRRNVELINITQQIAAETTKSIIQLQTEYVQSAFDQFSVQLKQNLSTSSFDEKTTHQSEIAKATVDQVIEHAREVNSLLSKSNEKIIESIQRHFKESLDDSASMAKKAKTKI